MKAKVSAAAAETDSWKEFKKMIARPRDLLEFQQRFIVKVRSQEVSAASLNKVRKIISPLNSDELKKKSKASVQLYEYLEAVVQVDDI